VGAEQDIEGPTPNGRLARLDVRALAQVGASRVLALSPEAWGSLVLIRSSAPATRLLSAQMVTVPAQDDEEDYDESSLVALLEVLGPLAQRAQATLCGYVDGYDAIAARFAAAISDPRVGAVVLVVDSPGGDVAGAEEAFASMRGARDRAGKPVYAYAGEMAASAAYWMSATVASSGVYLPRSGAVGSVGVIAAHVDESAALDKLLEPQPKDRMNSAVELRDVLRSLASRDASQSSEAYNIAMPTPLSVAPPKLHTVLQTSGPLSTKRRNP
jgi:ClpP class serine protease